MYRTASAPYEAAKAGRSMAPWDREAMIRFVMQLSPVRVETGGELTKHRADCNRSFRAGAPAEGPGDAAMPQQGSELGSTVVVAPFSPLGRR